MKKLLIGMATLIGLLSLTACPGRIDPGSNTKTNLGSMSTVWGVPLNRVNTAGFNGYPSEPNDAGPANAAQAK